MNNISSASVLALCGVVSYFNNSDKFVMNAFSTHYDMSDVEQATIHTEVEGIKNLIGYLVEDVVNDLESLSTNMVTLASHGCYVSLEAADEYTTMAIIVKTKKGTVRYGGDAKDPDAAFAALFNL